MVPSCFKSQMAEARRDEEEEPREFRELAVLRNRRGQSNPTTDRSERNKPERRLSQGALSSIRAAIKRTTSTRNSSQGDHTRDRRRPEITILSAEPLAANAWFPGASGGFPSAPPPAQPIWGGNIPASPQPPPSYDQVIKEKTQEQVPPLVATRRQSTTIATQTDFLLDSGPECSATPQPTERRGSAARRPLKPPRPTLPKPKPEADDTVVLADQACIIPEAPPVAPTDPSSTTSQQAADAQLCLSHLSCVTQSDPSLLLPAHCDEITEAFGSGSVERPSQPSEAGPAFSPTQRPVPLPRSKPSLQSISREVKVQTLVRIKDEGDSPQIPLSPGGLPSGKYLQELLDIFCTDDQCDQGNHSSETDPSDQADPSDETDPSNETHPSNHSNQTDPSNPSNHSNQTDPSNHSNHSNQTDPSDGGELSEQDDSMSVSHSQRNIKAKIHAFEKQAAVDMEEEGPLVKPEPRPRTQYPKPPAVATKPTFTPRPSSMLELSNASGSSVEKRQKDALIPPTPAPRPLLHKAPSESEITLETPAGKVPLIPPSRRSVMARAKTFSALEEGPANTPPTPPPKIKPMMNSVSLTNHEPAVILPPPPPKFKPAADNASLTNHEPAVILPPPPPKFKPAADPVSLTYQAPPLPLSKPNMENGNGNVDRPFGQTPIKPQRSVNFHQNPPNLSRKPTLIRVPSKVDDNEIQEPPPLPVQKPIGGVPLPIRKPSRIINRPSYPPPPVEASNPEGFSVPMPELSLPPRPVGGKVAPARPPPAKAAPGRPPRPAASGLPGPAFQAGRAATLPTRSQSSRGLVKKVPVQPPRPSPGHPLYNSYTLEIPHAIAEFDYNGSNTGELSFQKNEVLVLLDQTDNNTFECQVGDAKGPVQKSYLKIITPLSSASSMPQIPPPADARRGSSGLQAQALYDFVPERPEELALKAGDLVSMVEWVDGEWCRGCTRGATGMFPVSYVRMLSVIPAPPGGQKAPPGPASISGPRCVARYEFEGDQSNELSFPAGEVIRLKEYIGQEWARGELNGFVGIFPLDYVEVVEDLPPPPPTQQNVQMRIPLPGMVPASKNQVPASKNQVPARPSQLQLSPAGAEWCRAQYDFTAETDEDLAFQQGAVILITEHLDAEWCRGRLDGREGCFPVAFVEPCPAPPEGSESPGSGGGGRARALFDFVSESEEELSIKVGDIITGLESIDDEWFLGELNGMHGLVPRNYVQVLKEP
ncbi:SH3 domain-containing protein 19 isoform X2 [Conger conger]|uniref:SH3 domain-containing protein 19 isoform X2 n=1 Tax=Conger conger TaxID=82655 RepID=UPI002A5AED30|nr:SH3 domain-containing protein 19 isoform X2 [Conger conger]